MLGKIQVIKRNKVKSLVVKTNCSIKELQIELGKSYKKIREYMNNQGAMPAGAPYVAYFNQDMENMEIEIGIPIAMYMPDTEEIIMSEIPEGNYVRAVFTGPYNELKQAYGEMTQYMTENSLTVSHGVYESYLNDPGNTMPTKLMTEILFSI